MEMAVFVESINYIPESSQNILSEVSQLLKIRDVIFSGCNTKSLTSVVNQPSDIDNPVYDPGSSKSEDVNRIDQDNSNEESTSMKNDDFSYKDVDLVYFQVEQNLSYIQDMIDSLIEQKKSCQEVMNSLQLVTLQSAQEIVSASKCMELDERMGEVVEHITEMSAKVSWLKGALRTADQKNHLKIHVKYHRDIVNFFAHSKYVLKHLEECLVNFRNCHTLGDHGSMFVDILKSVQRLTTESHKYADVISEFKTGMEWHENKI